MGDIQGSSLHVVNYPSRKLSNCNHLGATFVGENCLGNNCPGDNCRKCQFSGGNYLGGNCPEGNCPVPRSYWYKTMVEVYREVLRDVL